MKHKETGLFFPKKSYLGKKKQNDSCLRIHKLSLHKQCPKLKLADENYNKEGLRSQDKTSPYMWVVQNTLEPKDLEQRGDWTKTE